MKKWLFLLVLLLFFSCKSDDKCGVILDKISTSEQYIFVICFNGCDRITSNDFQGSMRSDVQVDAAIFKEFSAGDNYCVE
jgi:hypothetical protein